MRRLSVLLFAVLCMLFSVAFNPALSPLYAQDSSQSTSPQTSPQTSPWWAVKGLSDWQKTALRAEDAIASERASDAAFEELRTQLVDWRQQFLQNQSRNKSNIDSLKSQISALGVVAEGQSEAPQIAAKRKELQMRLNQLQAPVKTAEVAYSRADGMISRIDDIIRARQKDALLKLGPSPLNPAIWPQAITSLNTARKNLGYEISRAWGSTVGQAQLKDNLPIIVALLLIGLALAFRGNHWMERLTNAVQKKTRTPLRWFTAFLLSIAQLVLPLIGLILLTQAVDATKMLGLRGEIALSSLVGLIVSFMVASWLGGRIFSRREYIKAPLNLSAAHRKKGRFFTGAIGFLVGVNGFLTGFGEFEGWNIQSKVVLAFPILLLSCYALIRIAKFMRLHVVNEDVEDQERSYKNRMVYFLGRGVVVLAITGAVLAAIGYFKASQSIIYPTALSLALLAFLLLVQRVVSEVYGLIIGNQEGASDALIPVLVNFALWLVSLPFFALMWGMRTTDLSELWTGFQEGFSLGETRVSPSVFLTFAIIFVIGYMLTRLLQGTLRNTVLPKTKIDLGGRNAIISGLGYIGIFLSAVIAISSAGIDLSSLAIVAGALSVGIGFGLQNIVSNFVAGIILLIERPISEGDWIEVGGKSGIVRDISVRSTRIETFDRTDVIVPNSDFVSGTVTNYTRGNTIGRLTVKVGVAYGTDTKKVEKILMEIGKAHPAVHKAYNVWIYLRGFGADSVDFEIRVILRDVDKILTVHSDINHEIIRRFGEEGIEIPFAQRDVWLRNPESLQPKKK